VEYVERGTRIRLVLAFHKDAVRVASDVQIQWKRHMPLVTIIRAE
jgi:hypothetical protein